MLPQGTVPLPDARNESRRPSRVGVVIRTQGRAERSLLVTDPDEHPDEGNDDEREDGRSASQRDPETRATPPARP